MSATRHEGSLIPSHWIVEVGNALLTLEHRSHLTQAEDASALRFLDSMPIHADPFAWDHVQPSTVDLPRSAGLTAFDACYIESAARTSEPSQPSTTP